jgi:hypothetical protein
MESSPATKVTYVPCMFFVSPQQYLKVPLSKKETTSKKDLEKIVLTHPTCIMDRKTEKKY